MRPEKESIVAELKEKVSDSVFVIVADYQGLSVDSTNDLRGKLHGADAQMQIVKNRVFGHVVEGAGLGAMRDQLSGPSAMVYGKGDVSQAAKILKEFVKQHEKPVVKVGALEGVVLTAADVEELASLPSREVLLSMVVGTMAAPMSGVIGVFQQKAATLLNVLKAAADKKGSE